MLTELFIELSRIKVLVTSSALPDYSEDYTDTRQQSNANTPIQQKKTKNRHVIEDEEWFRLEKLKPKKNLTKFYPCDKKSDLYVLQQDFIKHNREYAIEPSKNDSRYLLFNSKKLQPNLRF